MPQPIAFGNVYGATTECRWPKCRADEADPDIPLCERHFAQVGIAYLARRSPVTAAPQSRAARLQEADDYAERRKRRMLDQSVVYYVRIGDHVKIGYTINLRQRLGALRLTDDALLATEPGSREQERIRHRQFADERIGRRENFNPSRRLLAHIEAIRAEHGEPVITTWRNGAA